MKLIVKYRICLYLFLLAFSLYSCSESEAPVSDMADNQARLNFLIRTTPKEEKLTLGVFGTHSGIHSAKTERAFTFCQRVAADKNNLCDCQL